VITQLNGALTNPATAYFYGLKSDYYWQCQSPMIGPEYKCGTDGIPSLSFRSGYMGYQSDGNDLFVILELPGEYLLPYCGPEGCIF
jgi:hypothetical protein